MRRTRHTSDSRLFFDWLEIAARDLLAARLLLEQGQCLDIAGFHCQQCLEKALKAYLLDRTGVLPDGHNLTWLCKQVAKFDASFRPYIQHTAGSTACILRHGILQTTACIFPLKRWGPCMSSHRPSIHRFVMRFTMPWTWKKIENIQKGY